jgi:hypothetical protein
VLFLGSNGKSQIYKYQLGFYCLGRVLDPGREQAHEPRRTKKIKDAAGGKKEVIDDGERGLEVERGRFLHHYIRDGIDGECTWSYGGHDGTCTVVRSDKEADSPT